MTLRSLFLIVTLAIVASSCGELPAELLSADVPRAHVLGERIAALGAKVRADETHSLLYRRSPAAFLIPAGKG